MDGLRSEFLAHVSLADHATAIRDRLYVNGGGWTVRSPMPQPWAVTLEVKVPWHYNNRVFDFQLDLLDADGQPVEVETTEGTKPICVGGQMRLTAGPALQPGSQITGVAAAIMPLIPLAPASLFEWRLTIADETREEWRVAFMTTALPAQQPRQQAA